MIRSVKQKQLKHTNKIFITAIFPLRGWRVNRFVFCKSSYCLQSPSPTPSPSYHSQPIFIINFSWVVTAHWQHCKYSLHPWHIYDQENIGQISTVDPIKNERNVNIISNWSISFMLSTKILSFFYILQNKKWKWLLLNKTYKLRQQDDQKK